MRPDSEEITRILGEMDAHLLREIEELAPTQEELEEVAARLAGADDVLGEARLPPTGRAGAILEMMARADPDRYPDR